MGLFNWKKKDKEKTEERPLDSGLEKTKRSLFEKLTHAIAGKSVVDDEVLDSLEEVLIASDVGVETTQNIIERLEARVARDKYLNTEEVNRFLCEEIIGLLDAAALEAGRIRRYGEHLRVPHTCHLIPQVQDHSLCRLLALPAPRPCHCRRGA